METMDDDSNDVEVTGEEIEKPIMTLFKRLIDKTAKAILTNTQITHLIQQEFDIDCSNLHPLELSIYIDIMKKFLKDWPQWDDFDKTVNRHKAKNDTESINQLLEVKHNELKDYLTLMLSTAKKSAEKAIETTEKTLNEKKSAIKNNAKEDERDVVMEVQCSRARLNQLFFEHPVPDLNDTIFNVSSLKPPTKITNSPPTYQSILNWWGVSIFVNLNRICLKRHTMHEFKHVLENKKLEGKKKKKKRAELLDTRLQEKTPKKKMNQAPKTQIMEVLEILKSLSQKTAMKTDMEVLLWFLRDDIKRSDEVVSYPQSYRRYMNKYPYRRYLSTKVDDVEKNDTKYDLAVEETIKPMYMYTISRFEPTATVTTGIMEQLCRDKVSVKCEPCNATFDGVGLLKSLQQHFWSYHTHEPDWTCTNCKTEFKMAALSGQRWTHEC